MNLKNRLKNILGNKSATITISVVILFMIVAGVSVLALNHRQKAEAQRAAEAENLLMQKQAEQYSLLCAEYNSAVEEYNVEVNRISTLFDKLSKYDVLNSIPKIEPKATIQNTNNKIDATIINELSNQKNTICENTKALNTKYADICISAYDTIIERHTVLAEAFDEMVKNASIDYIDGIPNHSIKIEKNKIEPESPEFSLDDYINEIEAISNETQTLAGYYSVIDQITNPNEQWVIQKLKSIASITETMPVTSKKDPNQLLGKNGGYVCCVYFSLKNIDQNSMPGESIVDKGTDAGGSIEVYPNVESAKNRCAYLSQFDNTLLYSGSYVIVGTMVIRTSYKLTDEEQIKTTNDIIKAFTTV